MAKNTFLDCTQILFFILIAGVSLNAANTYETFQKETTNSISVSENLSNYEISNSKILKFVENSFTKPNVNIIVELILSFLLPPLAVFLHDGISTMFWISILLTLLFWVPGVVFALLVVLDVI